MKIPELVVLPYDTLQQLVNMAETISNTCEAVVEARAVLDGDVLSEEETAEFEGTIDKYGQYVVQNGNNGFNLDGYFTATELEQMAYFLNRSR